MLRRDISPSTPGARTLVLGALAFALLVTGVAVIGHAQEDPTPPATREITDAEISVTMELLMQARSRAALSYLDSLAAVCAGQPLYLITRGRVLIEFIPPDDHKKDHTKEVSEPTLSVFEEAIELCSRGMDEDEFDPQLLLYRGWAWMQKSHIHALGRSFYTAGRDAGKGKSDLEKYLAEYPDNPSANGLLGAFLYFTDAIPGVIKMLSKLLFLPTGDRDRGLEMMHRAVREENPFGVDYTRLLNNVYVFFEGRYEEGLEGATALVDRYPAYPRPVVALATANPFDPIRHIRYTSRIDRFISLHENRDPTESDRGAANVVRAARAGTERVMGRPDRAIERLQEILGNAPEQPDWIGSFARFQLGQLYAASGRLDEAREMLDLAIDDHRSDLFRAPAKKAREDVKNYQKRSEAPAGGPDGRWIEAIYAEGEDTLTAIAARCEERILDSLPAAFYFGECQLLLGNPGAAIEIYEDIIKRRSPAWEYTLQMIACTRLAEIAALSADYVRAAEYQERAMDFYQNEYRVDWMLEGRRQYFERLGTGDTPAPAPTLLSRPE